jgi:hypothetical protein
MEGRAIEQDKAGLGLPVLELAPRLEPELPLQDCNGRRDTPDAYGSLATVRSTAASSRACRVCRAWGTIGRRRRALPTRRRQQQCVPDHATHATHARWPRRGSRVLTSTPQRSTPSGSGAAHVHGRRRRSARLGRPGQRLPTSSAHERAHQAIASPCPSWDHPVADPSTTGDVGSAATRAWRADRCGQPVRGSPGGRARHPIMGVRPVWVGVGCVAGALP